MPSKYIKILKRCCSIESIQYSRGKVVQGNFFKAHPNFKGKLRNNSWDTGKGCIKLWNKVQAIL